MAKNSSEFGPSKEYSSGTTDALIDEYNKFVQYWNITIAEQMKEIRKLAPYCSKNIRVKSDEKVYVEVSTVSREVQIAYSFWGGWDRVDESRIHVEYKKKTSDALDLLIKAIKAHLVVTLAKMDGII